MVLDNSFIHLTLDLQLGLSSWLLARSLLSGEHGGAGMRCFGTERLCGAWRPGVLLDAALQVHESESWHPEKWPAWGLSEPFPGPFRDVKGIHRR